MNKFPSKTISMQASTVPVQINALSSTQLPQGTKITQIPNTSSVKPEEVKKDKIKKKRLKLDEKTLFDGENGVKKFYKTIESMTFKETTNDVRIKIK
jgi:hypothetical protein